MDAGAPKHDGGSVNSAWLPRLVDFVHKNLLWFLVGSYVLAAVFPAAGLWIKDVSLGHVPLTQIKVSLPMAMLAVLLLNAGLGVEFRQLSRLRHHLGQH